MSWPQLKTIGDSIAKLRNSAMVCAIKKGVMCFGMSNHAHPTNRNPTSRRTIASHGQRHYTLIKTPYSKQKAPLNDGAFYIERKDLFSFLPQLCDHCFE